MSVPNDQDDDGDPPEAEPVNEALARSNARLRVLAELSHQFTTPIEYAPLLQVIVRAVADQIGDACSLTLLDAHDEWLSRVASAHRDAELDDAFKRALVGVVIPKDLAKSLVATVARTGVAQYLPDVSPDSVVERANDEIKPLLTRLNVHSIMVVPVRSRDTILGSLTLMRSGPGRSYTRDDLTLLTEVADRAGMAIENARLLDEARARSAELAETNVSLRQAERAMRQLATIVESSTDAIVSVTLSGVVLTWNGGAERLFGYTASEITGRNIDVLFPEDKRDELALIGDVVRERAMTVETVRQRKDGARVDVSITLSPILGGDGRPFGVSGIVRDITQRRKLEQQVILSERLASVGMLAAGVAHEINNPLAYVMGNLELVQRQMNELKAALPASVHTSISQMLDDARDGTDRIARIVQGLQTFSRAERAPYARLSLPPILETAVSLAQNELKHRARLVRDYAVTPPVLGDEGRLVQVFVNLLVNAAHALHMEGDVQLITRTDERGWATVEVRDSGRGIPESAREHIFDAFFTTKPIGAGTGLGLSISRNIVSAHGGEISFDSTVGKGTTFRVTLPPASAGSERTASPAPATPSVETAHRGKVIVIDDEPMIGRFLGAVLAADHDVCVCLSGQDALARFRAGERFDAILCDLMMPGMTGMELHAELTRLCRDQAERMVFITGGAFTAASKAFLDNVPNARLHKPFNSAKVRELSRSFLR